MAGACVVHSGNKAIPPLVAAALIWLVRLFLKVGIVVTFEMPSSHRLFTLVGMREVFDRCIEIMYKGATVCTAPQLTIPMFKLGGVLQWAAFYALSFVF